MKRVGECLRSSVGLATNRYLAKVASDMEKPDGLVALTLDILPEALRRLTLRDLPGVGGNLQDRYELPIVATTAAPFTTLVGLGMTSRGPAAHASTGCAVERSA